jgi:hypothetical protein
MTTEGPTLAVDELVVPAEAVERPTPGRERARPGRWLAVLAAGFVLQVAWRLYLYLPLIGPTAHADEDGYLFAARVTGGGPNAMLPAWSIMRAIGYPLILSPIHWFVQDPTAVYRGVHIVNAIVGALIFPLVYLLGRRMFDFGRWPAAGIAFVLATLPSAVFFGEFALTDAFLPTLVLFMLVALHGMVASSGRAALWYGAFTGAAAGYAANTHVRGQVMIVVICGVIVVAIARKWVTLATGIVAATAAGVVYVAGLLANTWLEAHMFANGSFVVDNRIFDRLTSVNGVLGVVIDAGGQLWHLSTSTWGLGGIGLVAGVFALVRREGPRATRIVLGVALAVTVGIALATATGIPYETEKRVNNHVYGRYVAIFAAFWVLVGVVALLQATTRRAIQLAAAASALVVGTIAVVAVFWGDWMRRGIYVNFDSPELSFLTRNWKHLQYFRVTAIVVVLIAMFALLLPQWPKIARIGAGWWKNRGGVSLVAAGVIGAVMLYNLAGTAVITRRISQLWVDMEYHSGALQLKDAGIRPGDKVVQATTSISWMTALRDQHQIYWESVQSFDPLNGAPPGNPKFVIASTGTGKPTDWYGWDHGYEEVMRFKDGYAGFCVVWKLHSP